MGVVVDEEEEGLSLEELGSVYKQVMAEAGLLPAAEGGSPEAASDASSPPETASGDPLADETQRGEEADSGGADLAVSPLGIVEAALFVGHPQNQPLPAAALAGLMRDVTEAEIDALVAQLNAAYQRSGQALRIRRVEGGYAMGLCEEVAPVKRAFYGKVREARLSQAAVEVLALVAYQPGITAGELASQRGKDCGALLAQLVRRNLLEIQRKPHDSSKPIATYHPTPRFLNLLGLRRLDDLPQVDETDISPRA